ncbi:hypothetical protein JCM6882_008970 [Rhodosporidiobolus microsporus]
MASSDSSWSYTVSWYANKAILVSSSFLLGAFFTHWLSDHPLIWQGPEVPSAAVEAGLRYYSHIYHAPPFYVTGLSGAAAIALGAAALKLIINPVAGMLFDGATVLLIFSSITVYTSNVLAALRYLPLDQLTPGSSVPKLNSLGEVRLVEALQSVAASHMIIAVSLTGVLALQGAQGWAERPPTAGSADEVPNPMGAVPASMTAPIPAKGEKEPEKGLR